MANLTPLRNIHLSGGLFTENLLLKIRDKKDKIPEVQWNTFGEKWQEEKKRYYEVWDWAKRLFGEIANKLDTWTIEDRFEKWIKPLLQKLGHESEPKPSIDLIVLSEEEQDNILNRIQVSHQLKNHAKIGLHICEDENFDERNDTNYQKKSQHDHFQRFILLNEGVRWGFLSNGKHVRLLGEYSNIYAKGYIQFNLDSIFINKDESEFWVLYALIHHSRFSEIYSLNPNEWIKKLKKKWEKNSEILSKDEAEIYVDLISDDILSIYKKILIDFINKADDKGVLAVKSSDSEIFMKNLNEKGLDLGELGRDFYLKELDSAISDIKENLSIIQRLQKRSQEEGIEAGKKLRENVKKAIELMGEGLMNSSKAFSDDIIKGEIEIKDFYQELLRITYRIIFVLYSEAKDLLPGVATIYYNDLGLTFLRKKAQQPIRDDQNTDIWYRLKKLFEFLDKGEISLGINAFSGELFNPNKVPLILNQNYNLSLNNSRILKIIRELTIVDLGIGLQLIDYAQIGEEEIGSIYEALLDFQPKYIKKDSPIYHFILEEIDTDRKGSGTYYTPKGLIDILLKTALRFVLEDKLNGKESKNDKLKALLDLKICDPACGGGSFLLASIDYLGKIYAQIDSEEELPDEDLLRESRRKILQNCIYGVDLNPMALELAKISLWLKAAVKDKPLTFLDNHLKEGNSLIGFTKKQKIGQIPKKAFNAVKGKKKTDMPDEINDNVINAQKRLKDFKVEAERMINGVRSIQKTLLPYQDSEDYAKVAFEVFEMEESNLNSIKEKEKCYLKLRQTNSWKNLNLQYNLWTSAFFWKTGEGFIKDTPTDALIFNAKKGNLDRNMPAVEEVNRLKEEYQFFNWFLEFPEIFQKKNPGFDCILSNPPWEVPSLKEMEFFSGKDDNIVNTLKRADRQKKIKGLSKTNPKLYNEYVFEYRKLSKKTRYYKDSKFYILTSEGNINLYPLFLEREMSLINNDGRIGTLVQSSILTGKRLSRFFQFLAKSNSIHYVFEIINRKKYFPVDSRLKFCLITLLSPRDTKTMIRMGFSIEDHQIVEKYLEKNRENDFKKDNCILNLTFNDFALFNPNTLNTPVFESKRDYNLVYQAYQRAPVIFNKQKNHNLWNIEYKGLVQTGHETHLYYTKDELIHNDCEPEIENSVGGIWLNEKNERFLPLYTGSSIWYYDHRYNEVIQKEDSSKKRKSNTILVSEEKHQNPYYFHIPMYWVKESEILDKFPKEGKERWLLGYRKISASTNRRGFVISPLPRYIAAESLSMIFFNEHREENICFIANLSSIPFDYITRNKLSGVNYNFFIFEQFPVFPPEIYSKELITEIRERVLKLVYKSWDIQPFAIDYGIKKNQPPFKWNETEREVLKGELDAIFALLYGYSRDDLVYILETFNTLKDYELREFGEFRTKKLVIESYDRFNTDPELGPLFRLEGVDLEKLKGE